MCGINVSGSTRAKLLKGQKLAMFAQHSRGNFRINDNELAAHNAAIVSERTAVEMQTTDVSCAVIVSQGMILAANRGEQVSNSGIWEFPGGKPKKGETPEDCVVRRVREELNLNINILDAMNSFTVQTTQDKSYTIHPFFAEIANGSIELTHHSRAEWFMPMQLMSLAWPETDLPIIDEIVGRIFKTGKIV